MLATGERGATLIELMVALAILALAGAIAFPTMDRGFAQAQFRRTAEALSADLRVTRGLALVAGRPVALSLAGDGGGWQSGAGVNRHAPDSVRLSGSTRILFFPDGSNSGGAIALTGTTGNRRAEIVVDAVTGAIGARGL